MRARLICHNRKPYAKAAQTRKPDRKWYEALPTGLALLPAVTMHCWTSVMSKRSRDPFEDDRKAKGERRTRLPSTFEKGILKEKHAPRKENGPYQQREVEGGVENASWSSKLSMYAGCCLSPSGVCCQVETTVSKHTNRSNFPSNSQCKMVYRLYCIHTCIFEASSLAKP